MAQRAIVTQINPRVQMDAGGTVQIVAHTNYCDSATGATYEIDVAFVVGILDTLATMGLSLSAAVIAQQPSGFNVLAGTIVCPDFNKV